MKLRISLDAGVRCIFDWNFRLSRKRYEIGTDPVNIKHRVVRGCQHQLSFLSVLGAHRIVFWWTSYYIWWTSRSTKIAGFMTERIHTPLFVWQRRWPPITDDSYRGGCERLIKLEDIAPHNFFLVWTLITVFADSFIIAYLCEFRRRIPSNCVTGMTDWFWYFDTKGVVFCQLLWSCKWLIINLFVWFCLFCQSFGYFDVFVFVCCFLI